MLTTSIKKYEEKLIQKGIEIGREKVREEGRIAVKKEFIIRAINKRFGNVQTDFENKINAINDIVLLDTIIDTVIDAKKFSDIDKLL